MTNPKYAKKRSENTFKSADSVQIAVFSLFIPFLY